MPPFLLLLVSLLSIGAALPWQGPQQTQTATYTANLAPAPTSNANEDISILELKLRDIYPVSVCGWIGGDVAQPAYCSTQSSCVWNSDESIVGCCATSGSNCAFYTSCIDMNSPQQTSDSENVYTCRGTSLCYSNTYPGSYKQWGCGSTNWATNIETSYSGMAADISLQIVTTGNGAGGSTVGSTAASSTIETLVSATESTTSTPQVTSLAATLGSKESSHTTAGFSTTSAFSNSSLSATPASPTSPSSKSSVPMAAVAAGAIGGIAAIAMIGGLCLFGKRKGWFHRGPGHQHIPHSHSTQALAPEHHDLAMSQTRDHSLGTSTPRSHHTGVGAFSAEPKFDKRGLLITESHEMASGSGVKKSSKPKSSPSSVSGAKKSLKTNVGSASDSRVKKTSRQRAG
ncbi:uncharacterized protein K444DRAFT_665862 [Hyaloscypha bicolor E]|uniref:Uncharacterized protein n=1 Tax=Hyaloscypha bicolor E TaxID=1095630 RepID=A0A2J6SZK0_9HELO|nr:uncharacterized protein K444DRAFT_665862 [Hyaloscypha bicolor E]PMD56207.1 hypothetical protein K444DRAFT_665862 [Hyaloscypha bicolor E]